MRDEWLIYALGGGWGHITRALALGRIAATQRKVSIITNTPYLELIKNREGCGIHGISDQAGFRETCRYVRQIIQQNHYSHLIIDSFPRGLGGELADILPQLSSTPRILIHRDIHPEYVTTKGLRSFVQENFEKIIVPGEGDDLPFSDLATHTAPWLIRDANELPPKYQTRSQLLKVAHSQKTILICASGQASELKIFGELARRISANLPNCAVRILAAKCPQGCPPGLWVCHYPGIECIAAADLVIGGAGYNTVYECTSLSVPLIALAFPRLYDRQQKRAKKCNWVQNIDQAIASVEKIINSVELSTKISVPIYINGAIQAVDEISTLYPSPL